MSTIQHTSTLQSLGITTINCDTDDESEPKTILEIGGISRPIPTYAIQPHRNPSETVLVSAESSLSNSGIWLGERTEIVPSPHRAFTDFQEHKIFRLNNGNWTPNPYKPMVITKVDNLSGQSMYFHSTLSRYHMPNVLTCTLLFFFSFVFV